MDPKALATLLVETATDVAKPLQERIDAIEELMMSLVGDIEKAELKADVVKADLRALVADLFHEAREKLLQDKDALRGDPGEPGPRGLMGPQGEGGPRGEKGDPGPRGEKGDDGRDGQQGPRGERGEKGDTGPRGDPGPSGRDGAAGEKGDAGPRGLTGFLAPVEAWRLREYAPGEVVTRHGGTWQARRTTNSEPGPDSNAWELMADGVAQVEMVGKAEDMVALRLSSGKIVTTPALTGAAGAEGRSFEPKGTWMKTGKYQRLDVVQKDGSSWLCLEDGVTTAPGTKGCNQWKLLAMRGPRGPKGDMPAIDDIVARVRELDVEEAAITTREVTRTVRQYLSGLRFDG